MYRNVVMLSTMMKLMDEIVNVRGCWEGREVVSDRGKGRGRRFQGAGDGGGGEVTRHIYPMRALGLVCPCVSIRGLVCIRRDLLRCVFGIRSRTL
jgi:hypothetical protein